MSRKQETPCKVVPLREEFMALANRHREKVGAALFALVLAQMEYWQGRKERDEYVAEELERARNGRGPTEKGWVKKAADQLSGEIFGAGSKESVTRALGRLVQIGVLRRRKSGRSRVDHTYQYRVDLVVLGRLLGEVGYTLDSGRWKEMEGIELAPGSGEGNGKCESSPCNTERHGDESECHHDESKCHHATTITERREYVHRTHPKKYPLNLPRRWRGQGD